VTTRSDTRAARERRLEAALRENLKRRKVQARDRKEVERPGRDEEQKPQDGRNDA
jgi:hypothetical protein